MNEGNFANIGAWKVCLDAIAAVEAEMSDYRARVLCALAKARGEE